MDTHAADAALKPGKGAKAVLNAADAVLGLIFLGSIMLGLVALMKGGFASVFADGWSGQSMADLLRIPEGGSWHRVFSIDSVWWLLLIIPFVVFKVGEGFHLAFDPAARARWRESNAAEKEAARAQAEKLEQRKAEKKALKEERRAQRGPSRLSRVARKVWNGPFAAPPLQHPVALGWVALKLLETLWRVVLVLVIGILLLVAAVYAESVLRPPLHTQLSISAQTKHPDCTGDMPLRIEVTNNSGRTVGEWSLAFRAYEHRRSTDIAVSDYWANPRTLDYVIEPGATTVLCSQLPPLSRKPEGGVRYQPHIAWASPFRS